MEAGVSHRPLLLVLGLVLLVRLPFLNQAIQGDETVYITEAAHALIDPLHPGNTAYVFRGNEVNLQGHPHPPTYGWFLAPLLAVFGDVREIPFHAVYMVYSLIAAGAMWSLARRFSPQPLWATLLFLAVPAFVVNGGSLETDLPFLAFGMAAIALFVWNGRGSCVLAGMAMALAALTAYQAVFLTPILAVYVWLFHRGDRGRWLTLLTPVAVVAGWQIFQRFSTGAMPAAAVAGYFSFYQTLQAKLTNGLALVIHSWFIVFPALVPGAFLLAWRKRREPDTFFLLAWIATFFALSLVVFFAGSARYLLPMAAPVALLASRLRPRWLAAGVAAQMALSMGLAAVNYQHWDAYRRFAKALPAPAAGRRIWVDDEWGLRHYVQARGGLPLRRDQELRAGDMVVWSELSRAVNLTTPLAPVVPALEIRPSIPLRIIGLETHSGYSAASMDHLWPFGVSVGVIDRVHAEQVGARHVTLEYLPMNAAEAKEQIVSGIYDLEDHSYRWMAGRAVVVLKSPAGAMPLRVKFTIPEQARARRVRLLLDGREVASEAYAAPGTYTLVSAPVRAAGAEAMVEIAIDQTFSAPPDRRELGIVLAGVGFAP